MRRAWDRDDLDWLSALQALGLVETSTPEFIRWSLGHECVPRMAGNGDAPEHIERQLKALRAYGESVAAHRCLDGICFEPGLDAPPGPCGVPRGFRAVEVLNAYGATAEALPCVSCPVHVDREPGSPALAGCFGMIDWSPVAAALPGIVSAWLDQVTPLERWRCEFLPTNPPWSGLWADSPLRPPQLSILQALLERLVALGDAWRNIFERFLLAIRTAQEIQRPLHVTYFPEGRLSGRHWTVVPHCSRCKSPRSMASRVCPTCGLDARPMPARKRLGRGGRPYWPLADFLGPPTRIDLLRRYLGNRHWNAAQIDDYLLRIDWKRELENLTDEQT